MTGPEHYEVAERLLAITTPTELTVLKAQVHATLALAAATVDNEAHGYEWQQAMS